MSRKRILQLQDFNPHLTCSLCNGYFIDATTIIECLHSFCRACIVRYLETNRFCPVCDVQIHKSKPLLNIRKDSTLQALVYKLVPGLYQNEMRSRREFFAQHPEAAPSTIEIASSTCIYTPDEYFSLTLEHWSPNKDLTSSTKESSDDPKEKDDTSCSENPNEATSAKRYLRCPAAVSVAHIHKLIRAKYGLQPSHLIELLFRDEPLPDHLTLLDVAYIYKWKRKGPLSLSYRIYESSHKRMKLDALSSCVDAQLQASGPINVESTEDIKVHQDQVKPTEKNTNWQEVQLQISETGIMSVSGISLEHNNNLSTTNNNIFDDQTATNGKTHIEKLDPAVSSPKYLKLADSYSENTSTKNHEVVLGKLKENPCTGASKQQAKKSEGSFEGTSKNSGRDQVAVLPTQTESVSAEDKAKDSCAVGINSKTNNQKINETTDKTRGKNGSVPLKQVEIANLCTLETPKLPKELTKPAMSDSHIPSDSSKSNQINSGNPVSKKGLLHYQSTSSATSGTKQKYHQNLISNNNDKKNLSSASTSVSVSAVSPKPAKKDVSQLTVGFNTHKDPHTPWNPSFAKASYPVLKNNAPTSGPNVNTSADVKAEKAPKFFKMRNMPRYLGNPASGVKPMYQLSDNSKMPQTGSPTKSKNVVVKIDPKTLSPIVSVMSTNSLPGMSDSQGKPHYRSSPVSATQRSETEGANCSTTVTSGASDTMKKPPLSEKSKLACDKNQDSSSNALPSSTSQPTANSKSCTLTCGLVSSLKVNHLRSASTAAGSPSHLRHEFCNDGPLARSHHGSVPGTVPATTFSSLKLNNAPNFALNPATLNLLSSNLSFLPNASNFLYGNFSDFGPPLMRPGLNLGNCLGAPVSGINTNNSLGSASNNLPPGVGAYHSMPPSINMLFPHHRSSDRSSSNHTQVQTPAVQRIPASKGNNSTAVGHKHNQPQATNISKIVKSDTVNVSTNASSTNDDVLGTVANDQRTDKLAINLNNNSILNLESSEKIGNTKLLMANKDSSVQKEAIVTNGEFKLSSSVEKSKVLSTKKLSDTHLKTEIIPDLELKGKEAVKKCKQEAEMPLTEIAIKKTGDKHRNLAEEETDNNTKKVKLPSESLDNTSLLLASDVITKPCADSR